MLRETSSCVEGHLVLSRETSGVMTTGWSLNHGAPEGDLLADVTGDLSLSGFSPKMPDPKRLKPALIVVPVPTKFESVDLLGSGPGEELSFSDEANKTSSSCC